MNFLNRLKHLKLDRWIRGFTFTLIALVLPIYASKVYLKQDYTDFSVYYLAAKRAQHSQWSQIYNLLDGASPFRYAPPWILFFSPFAHLDLIWAQMLWYVLQYLFFGLGFFWIYKSLRLALGKRGSSRALTVTCLGICFILRLCLDSFTIGQVSSLMFFGFSLALYCWMARNSLGVVMGLLIPTFLKVGPGFLLGTFLSTRNSQRIKAAQVALVATLTFILTPRILLPSWESLRTLWSDWASIVQNDSNYYDSSHYGSQSIHSFLLRSAKSGWISIATASRLEIFCGLSLCAAVGVFWLLRRARSFQGRGLFFSLGLFVYMGLMPETFKYSLTPLAIPFVLLWTSRSKQKHVRRAVQFSLAFAILTISLAGKDIVGDRWFFALQYHSIPLLAIFLLGVATGVIAWEESLPSPLAKRLALALWGSPAEFPLWSQLPEPQDPIALSVLIPVALGSGYFSDPQEMIRTLELWNQTLLHTLPGKTFEILVIFWGPRVSQYHPVVETLAKAPLPQSTRLLRADQATGASSALRVGFLQSQGNRIMISHLEQPIDPEFLPEWVQQTQAKLDQGADLVRGDRRLDQSHFKIPVRFLALVYGRHQLGLLLNSLLQFFLGLKSQDTPSPDVAFTRRLAKEAFAVQRSRGALFQVELSLVGRNLNYRESDIPISIQLSLEKSLSRVFWESLSVMTEIPMLLIRAKKGCYHPVPSLQAVTADDWGLSPGVNAGILQLARRGVVKRVSIMANGEALQEGLDELTAIPGIELGLHLNLTYGRALHTGELLVPSPGRFLLGWLNPWSGNRNEKASWVRAEFIAQVQKIKNLGVTIRYLDGHHHIHLAPGLVPMIAEELQEFGIRQARLPWDPALWRTPQFPLLLLSAWARHSFKAAGLQCLPCYYPSPHLIQNHTQLRGALRSRLLKHPGSEIIVHPAAHDDVGTLKFFDSYQAARVVEFQSLQMLAPFEAKGILR